MNITKALADENRVRILAALQDEELCVCQLIELLELAPSTVSKHLSILRQARLVKSRKKGRWVYYSLPTEHILPTVAEALGWVLRSITAEPRIRVDAHRLAEILAIDPEVLCGHQSAD